MDAKVLAAYRGLVGAVLEDPGLVPRVRPWADRCPSEGLRAVLETLLELFEDEDADLDPGSVMTALGDHPVRDHVLDLVEFARRSDFPPHQLLDESVSFLTRHQRQLAAARLRARIAELSRAAEGGDERAQRELDETLEELNGLIQGGADDAARTVRTPRSA